MEEIIEVNKQDPLNNLNFNQQSRYDRISLQLENTETDYQNDFDIEKQQQNQYAQDTTNCQTQPSQDQEIQQQSNDQLFQNEQDSSIIQQQVQNDQFQANLNQLIQNSQSTGAFVKQEQHKINDNLQRVAENIMKENQQAVYFLNIQNQGLLNTESKTLNKGAILKQEQIGIDNLIKTQNTISELSSVNGMKGDDSLKSLNDKFIPYNQKCKRVSVQMNENTAQFIPKMKQEQFDQTQKFQGLVSHNNKMVQTLGILAKTTVYRAKQLKEACNKIHRHISFQMSNICKKTIMVSQQLESQLQSALITQYDPNQIDWNTIFTQYELSLQGLLGQTQIYDFNINSLNTLIEDHQKFSLYINEDFPTFIQGTFPQYDKILASLDHQILALRRAESHQVDILQIRQDTIGFQNPACLTPYTHRTELLATLPSIPLLVMIDEDRLIIDSQVYSLITNKPIQKFQFSVTAGCVICNGKIYIGESEYLKAQLMYYNYQTQDYKVIQKFKMQTGGGNKDIFFLKVKFNQYQPSPLFNGFDQTPIEILGINNNQTFYKISIAQMQPNDKNQVYTKQKYPFKIDDFDFVDCEHVLTSLNKDFMILNYHSQQIIYKLRVGAHPLNQSINSMDYHYQTYLSNQFNLNYMPILMSVVSGTPSNMGKVINGQSQYLPTNNILNSQAIATQNTQNNVNSLQLQQKSLQVYNFNQNGYHGIKQLNINEKIIGKVQNYTSTSKSSMNGLSIGLPSSVINSSRNSSTGFSGYDESQIEEIERHEWTEFLSQNHAGQIKLVRYRVG